MSILLHHLTFLARRDVLVPLLRLQRTSNGANIVPWWVTIPLSRLGLKPSGRGVQVLISYIRISLSDLLTLQVTQGLVFILAKK